MTSRAQTLVCLSICLVCFLSGWWVNGWRFEVRISDIKAEHAEQLTANASNALARYEEMEKTKDEAIKAAQDRAAKAEADAGRAAATVDSLRKQVASVPARIATATRAAVEGFANESAKLLGECTHEYQRMAAIADVHRNNERLLIQAWPSLE